jgi:hypothetical protein
VTQRPIDAALATASERMRRLRALDRLSAMADRGDFDMFQDKSNYRR